MTKELFDRLANVPKELLRFADALDANFDSFWGISNATNELTAIINDLKAKGGVDELFLVYLIELEQSLRISLAPIDFTLGSIYSVRCFANRFAKVLDDMRQEEGF